MRKGLETCWSPENFTSVGKTVYYSDTEPHFPNMAFNIIFSLNIHV
jgi:hypothetical protein